MVTEFLCPVFGDLAHWCSHPLALLHRELVVTLQLAIFTNMERKKQAQTCYAQSDLMGQPVIQKQSNISSIKGFLLDTVS